MPVAMKAIIPKSFLGDSRKLARIVENALTAIAEDIAVAFETTTETWRNKPDFAIAQRPGERVIATTDRIYGFVNDGTRPHVIVARKRALVFRPGGSPKTVPRVIGSSSGGKGSGVVFVRRVNHPGTEARAFDVTIAAKWRKRAPQVLQRSIDAAV